MLGSAASQTEWLPAPMQVLACLFASSFIGYSETTGGRQEMQVEEWAYGPSNGMCHDLRFVGGRFSEIDSKRN